MFRKSVGGQKWLFSKKFAGPLGYHLASSEVSETRSKNHKKNKKKCRLNRCKMTSWWEPYPQKIHISFLELFYAFFDFSIFSIFPPSQAPIYPFRALKGPCQGTRAKPVGTPTAKAFWGITSLASASPSNQRFAGAPALHHMFAIERPSLDQISRCKSSHFTIVLNSGY